MAFEPFFQFVRKLNQTRFGGLQTQDSKSMAFMRQLQKDLNQDRMIQTSLNQMSAVVVDIETTGFSPDNGDQILSIGAVKILNGRIDHDNYFYSLIQYEKDLASSIKHLTGLKEEELKNAPPLADVLLDFLKYTESLPFIAHHSNHEKRFFQHAFWQLYRTSFKHRVFDTSFLYRIIDTVDHSVRLETLCEKNQIEVKHRHHALGDAMLTAKLWVCYVEKVKEQGCFTMQDVYEKLARIP
ncbi:exonuclease domain-containing protein [Cytobacillus kochii]|uniref:exonuclease domain-containing protein n=1 Tax=Cytobacillus kochii TaxID=859143 RepID=UPI002480AD9C|nr:exonuclease domain-containing protein [Cytobacillus kochii]